VPEPSLPARVIAGHTFYETPSGRLCHCGMKWTMLLTATEDAISQPDWAHNGLLARFEYDQIKDERDKLWQTLNTK